MVRREGVGRFDEMTVKRGIGQGFGFGIGCLLLVVALLAAACGGEAPASGKYTQTWTTPYSETTCADWRDTMDEHQKFVMAADILYSSQKKVSPDVELPIDSLVGQFQGQIQGLCLTNPNDDITTVAFIVWTTGQDVFAP